MSRRDENEDDLFKGNEMVILTMMINGDSTQQIARKMHLTRSGVAMTVKRVRDRFGARSTAQLIAVLFRERWLE